MRLRPEFESVRSTLINQDEITMDGVLGKLLREETRIHTQAKLNTRPGEGDVVYAAPSGSYGLERSGDHAFAVGCPHFQQRVPMSELECHHCHVKGHLQKHCRQRNICVYCKKPGHIVLDCPSLQNRSRSSAGARSIPPHAGSSSLPAFVAQQSQPSSNGFVISPEAVEDLVNAALQRSLPTVLSSAFASLQTSGILKPWLLDSACFNHMKSDISTLKNGVPVRDMTL
ncbi:unnamed protein product [Linum trigynum]|uniref:CCHC-type domain-containing protein n=1 Tax=Linum trigynum TaxID=586398 RepID=A0AAV2CVE7_9ROSI